MSEPILKGIKNRILQHMARFLPGASSFRVACHRRRGVKIGSNTWIGYDVVLDTGYPDLITIGNDVTISMRVTIIAHFKENASVNIEDEVFIGPGAIILPNVRIGKGSVVTAGSVVNRSVAPMTMVQGNPAVPIARCGVPLRTGISLKEFSHSLGPIRKRTEL